MNWINTFEILCYTIVGILVFDILKRKNYRELSLMISGAIAGFSLELLAVRFTDIYHYSQDFILVLILDPTSFLFLAVLCGVGLVFVI